MSARKAPRRAATPRRATAPRITSQLLGNGVRLSVVRMPAVHSAALDVHVRVGSRFETPRENGISHCHEHMLHRGIPGHRTAHAQALAFEELGAAFGAMTYVDHGVLSCSLLLEISRMFEPSASQRCSTATCVSQQFTQRLQRLLTKTIPPSGK